LQKVAAARTTGQGTIGELGLRLEYHTHAATTVNAVFKAVLKPSALRYGPPRPGSEREAGR